MFHLICNITKNVNLYRSNPKDKLIHTVEEPYI